jgi:SAM-dependent methyltransferase
MNLASHWDHYWRSGQTHSCFYGGRPTVTDSTWVSFLTALPAGARILDLACGAGALARLVVASGKAFDVVGVDYASSIGPIPGVRLITGVAIEALPFSDESFDAVISQFGFEYADAPRAAVESTRVLAPGGCVALLVHAREGPPLKDLNDRATRAARLITPDGMVALMRGLGAAAAAGTPTAALERAARKAHRAALSGELDETTRWALDFAGEVLSCWKRFEPAYLVDNAATLAAELTSYCTRLEAMVAAALSVSDARILAARFAALGLVMAEVAPVNAPGGDLVGWMVQGNKAKL